MASAQTPAEKTLAREQFTVGVEAARAADWPRALDAFERSYGLFPHPETLFNVAGARQKLGQLVAASEAYRAYLRGSPPPDAARRAQAEATLADISSQIARVGIRVEGIAPGDVLWLDGQALSRSALESDLPVDPGEHALRLMHDQEVVGETDFAVHARERIEVLLRRTVEPPAAVAAPILTPRAAADASLHQDATRSHDDRSSGEATQPLRRKWWLWTAVAVVVAGGVTATVLLTRPAEENKEIRGNVGPGVVQVP